MGFEDGAFGNEYHAEGVAVFAETNVPEQAIVQLQLILPRGKITISAKDHDIEFLPREYTVRCSGYDDPAAPIAHPRWMNRTLRGMLWMLQSVNAYGCGPDGQTDCTAEQVSAIQRQVRRLLRELSREIEMLGGKVDELKPGREKAA